VSLALPGEALAACAKRLPRSARLRLARVRAELVRRLAALGELAPRRPRPTVLYETLGRSRIALREALVALVIAAATVQVTQNNRAVSRHVRLEQPKPLETFISYTRMIQSWNMFAPDAPVEDGTMVLDAETADGRHIDPFTGEAPDFELALRGPVPHSVMLSDYLFAIHFPNNERYRSELRNFLARWHLLDGRSPADRIVSYDMWWVSHRAPVRGSTTPTDYKRDLILRGR
jgi:hypothetical protein